MFSMEREQLQRQGIYVPRELGAWADGLTVHEAASGRRLDDVFYELLKSKNRLGVLDLVNRVCDAQIAIEQASEHQHGDFTTVNILWDVERERLNIIDWEWKAKYPPYFDLYSFLRSVGYLNNSWHWRESNAARMLRSFRETFMEENWFHEIVKWRISVYQGFSVAADPYKGLVDYLTITRDRYKGKHDAHNFFGQYAYMLRILEAR